MAIYKYVKITLTVLKFLIFYRKEFFLVCECVKDG